MAQNSRWSRHRKDGAPRTLNLWLRIRDGLGTGKMVCLGNYVAQDGLGTGKMVCLGNFVA